jgi:CubicO group peptidase (beta-lactamase class C family)
VTEKIVPGRVAGYNKGTNGWENAPYLSMTQPHAAGALMSSVDDLARWDKVLYTNKLVKQKLLQKAWSPITLADSRSTQYGYGWVISPLSGKVLIEHGGGINGFICQTLRMPEERIYVAILTNRTGMIDHMITLSLRIAFKAAGLPSRSPRSAKPEILTACQSLPAEEKEEPCWQVSEGTRSSAQV